MAYVCTLIPLSTLVSDCHCERFALPLSSNTRRDLQGNGYSVTILPKTGCRASAIHNLNLAFIKVAWRQQWCAMQCVTRMKLDMTPQTGHPILTHYSSNVNVCTHNTGDSANIRGCTPASTCKQYAIVHFPTHHSTHLDSIRLL